MREKQIDMRFLVHLKPNENISRDLVALKTYAENKKKPGKEKKEKNIKAIK